MAIDWESRRIMLNWAQWKSGSPIGLASSNAYELEARGRHEETPIPLLNGEALDVDKAISELPPELSVAVAEYWLRKGTIREKLRRLRCAAETFYRRLDQAHRRVREHLQRLRDIGVRKRAALANGRQTPLPDRNKSV
jgi:DNA-directed RNA polymerase specialized sigma24 family protein